MNNHRSLWDASQYQLIDFGYGRKLERFGPYHLERPSPAAAGITPQQPRLWGEAEGVFDSDTGWTWTGPPSREWWIEHQQRRFLIGLGPSGNVGLFPEQAMHWEWLRTQLTDRPNARCLNLFGYTGGSSLAMSQAGGQVTHVDASQPAVKWGRTNAEASGVHNVRWIVEDASIYATREIKRGQRYDLVVLDPPTYGHGPKGNAWKIDRDIVGLCCLIGMLLSEEPIGILLTGHSEHEEFGGWLFEGLRRAQSPHRQRAHLETGRSSLVSQFEQELDCGYYARLSFS